MTNKICRALLNKLSDVRIQTRAATEGGDDEKTITGYGAVFYNPDDAEGTEYRLWPDMVERIMPGSFDRAILEDDVRSLFNHDSNYVLGRNKADTLKLSVDDVGLIYETLAPDTQLIRDSVLAPIVRGDLSGSSIMFVVRRQVWVEEIDDEDRITYVRQIEEVELWEVGPVVFPAYEGTTAGLRDSDKTEIFESRDKWLNDLKLSKAADENRRRRIATRARSIEISD